MAMSKMKTELISKESCLLMFRGKGQYINFTTKNLEIVITSNEMEKNITNAFV